MEIIEVLVRGFQFGLVGSPIAIIFTVLSAVQVWRGVQQVNIVRQRWQQFVAAPLTAWKKSAAQQMAFYVAIPISIFIHELGHALFVKLFGGDVLAFGFFFFWGFVQPDRAFPPTEDWIIAVSGTWGNLIFAAVAFLWLGKNKSATLRYFARQTVASQIVFALIYYPIFTLGFGFGDWRTIYDFSQTPILSGGWAVFHAVVLLAYWLLRRRGWFDVLTFADAESAEKYTQLDGSLESNIERIKLLMRGGSTREAQKLAVQTARAHPESAESQFMAAATLAGNRQDVPRDAADFAERALALGIGAGGAAESNHILAIHERRRGNLPAAVHAIESAIRFGEQQPALMPNLATYYYDYALMLRQLGRDDEGGTALEKGVALAERAGDKESAEFFRSERVLFER